MTAFVKCLICYQTDQREVIILRHYADLSFKEIAALTNMQHQHCIRQNALRPHQPAQNDVTEKDRFVSFFTFK